MKSAQQKALSSAGLRLEITPDAEGFEFEVFDKSARTVALGWSRGTKAEAEAEAMDHPAVKIALRGGPVPS